MLFPPLHSSSQNQPKTTQPRAHGGRGADREKRELENKKARLKIAKMADYTADDDNQIKFLLGTL